MNASRIHGLLAVALAASLALCALAHAQADGLDGAIVQIESGGKTSRYRLTAAGKAPAEHAPAPAPVPAPAPGQPGKPPAPSFTVMLSGGMAPATIHVSAAHIPLAAGTPLTARYEWDFGDPDGTYNKLAGFNAAHVYRIPGTYTISLKLTDEAGGVIERLAEVKILPDARRTIYVAADGNDTNDGRSPDKPIRTATRAANLIRDNTRILFRHGDTFPILQPLAVSHANVVIGSYIDLGRSNKAPDPLPPRPVLLRTQREYLPMIVGTKQSHDLVVHDLIFDTIVDGYTGQKGMSDAIKPSGVNTTIRNCEFRNIGTAVNNNGEPRGVLIQDSTAPLDTGIRNYFAWVQGSDFVFLGNSAANSTREHIVRIGGADRILIAHNQFENLDRRQHGDEHDTAKGTLVVQRGSFAYIAQNRIGRGPVGVGPLGDGDGLKHKESRWRWAVIERNHVESWVSFNHGVEHIIARNNIVHRSDWAAFLVEGYNSDYGRGVKDATIANNTAINRGSRGNFVRVEGQVEGLTLVNNMYIAGKLQPGERGAAAVYVEDEDLRGFRDIAHNIWPTCGGAPMTEGAVHYVGRVSGGRAGYRTPPQWDQYPQVRHDRLLDVALNDRHAPIGEPASAGGVTTAGVWDDFHGVARPRGKVAVGAVEP
jgi:hypothetical protein